ERGLGRNRLAQSLRRQDARFVDRQKGRPPSAPRERLECIENRLMLDRARDQVTTASGLERLGGAPDREVVRFGAAACKYNFGGITADQAGHRRSRFVQRRLRLLSKAMDARCVAEDFGG